MTRQFPDFSNTMEWNLVARESHQAVDDAQVANRLPTRTYFIENSSVLIIGVDSESARSTWKTGGWAMQRLPFLPSTTSNFLPVVQTTRRWLRLRALVLCVFPKLVDDWILEVNFPYWFDDVSIEIWRYDGRDLEVFESLDRIEQKIDAYTGI